MVNQNNVENKIDNNKSVNCVVVIPVYLNELPYDDMMCVKRYEEILKSEKIVFIAPETINKVWYKNNFPNIDFVLFKDKYFTGTKSYNHLLLDEKFYDAFMEYEYMLIAQTDACIWSNNDRIGEFISKGYDYYGAPWIPERRIWECFIDHGKFRCCKVKGKGITMGNGGFCLRNIKKSKALIHEYRWRKIYWFFKRNEDIFFGIFGISNKCGFKLADIDSGNAFGREYHLRECVKNNDIPFAVHGWKKDFDSYDQMSEFLKANKIW